MENILLIMTRTNRLSLIHNISWGFAFVGGTYAGRDMQSMRWWIVLIVTIILCGLGEFIAIKLFHIRSFNDG
jgi:hypothetical protein